MPAFVVGRLDRIGVVGERDGATDRALDRLGPVALRTQCGLWIITRAFCWLHGNRSALRVVSILGYSSVLHTGLLEQFQHALRNHQKPR
jgi:hypothetical protein